jgi:tRNA threonylcarbamoyladenosine biosynthesis protein TsaE
MSTVVTWQTDCTSSEATEALAAKLGSSLRGGEVVELVGDLGSGKTTFVRGLARGADSRDHVASPTFTISRVYQAPPRPQLGAMIDPNNPPQPLEIHHFDFYRLREPGIIADELAEVIHNPNAVVIVEWANVVQHVLPIKRLTVQIESTSADGRRLSFRCPESLAYLIEAINHKAVADAGR